MILFAQNFIRLQLSYIAIFMSLFAEIQLAFSLFDHDGDGYITRLELKAALSSLNITETEERIDSMIKRLDKESKFFLF